MATLVAVDGFEHGRVSGTQPVFDAVIGTLSAIVTTPVRTAFTGSRALVLDPSATTKAVRYNITGGNLVMSFDIYFDDLPGAKSIVALGQMVGGAENMVFVYDPASGKFGVSTDPDAAAFTTGGPTVAADTWYHIDLKMAFASTTHEIFCKVDGGTEFSHSEGGLTNLTTGISAQLGCSTNQTFTAYYDDWVVSATAADYPLGRHQVVGLIPSSDGTHAITTSGDFDSFTGTAFSNATTTGHTFIGHRPLQMANTANQVIRQELGTTANYMEMLLENLPGSLDPVANGVRVFASHVEASASGASLGEARLLLADNTEVLTTGSLSAINSTEDPGTTVTLRKRMAIDPSGGWDRTKVDGLKVRVGFADNAPDVNFIDFLAMVALLDPQAESSSGSAASVIPAITQAATGTNEVRGAAASTVAISQAAIGVATEYSTLIAASAPALYWRLGEASGLPQDRSGNGAHATVVHASPTYGAAGLIDGDADTAVTLDAAGDSFSAADSALLDPVDWNAEEDRTMEMWFAGSVVGGGVVQLLFGKLNAWSNLNGGKVAFDESDDLVLRIGTTVDIITVAGAGWLDGEPHHLVIVRECTEPRATMYVDGVEVGTSTSLLVDDAFGNSQAFRVGMSTSGGFIGTIDEVAIYPSALSPATILEHYEAGAAVAESAGSAASVIPAITQAATGVVAVRGAAASVVAPAQAATGTVDVRGAAASQIAAVTQAATGTVVTPGVNGSAASVIPAVEQAATGAVAVRGAAASQIPTTQQAATGQAAVRGAAASTVAVTQSATGAVAVRGAAASSVPISQAATGAVAVRGPIASVIPAVTQSATGSVVAPGGISGVGASVIPAVTQSADADVAVRGAAASTIAPTQAATGKVATQGAAASSIPAVTQSASGAVRVAGSAASVIAPVTQQATGTVPASITGTAASVVAVAQAALGSVLVRANGTTVILMPFSIMTGKAGVPFEGPAFGRVEQDGRSTSSVTPEPQPTGGKVSPVETGSVS
jgi:hypothetical protein